MKNQSTSRSRKESSLAPTLELRPAIADQGAALLVAGQGWPLDRVRLKVGRRGEIPKRVISGTETAEGLIPDRDGSFLVELSTQGLRPGGHSLTAESGDGSASLRKRFTLRATAEPGPDTPRAQINKPYLRGVAFQKPRAGDAGGWPRGSLPAARRDWRRIHPDPRAKTPESPQPRYAAPIPGACNWTPLGPAPFSYGKGSIHRNNSGRLRSIAVDPTTPSRIYVGAASGGVWKSEDGGASWVSKTDDHFSLAIGALAIDPTSTNVVYAGTGEMVPGSDYGHYYGRGLLKSTDYGETWSELGATDFELAEMSRVIVDPLNATNLFVAGSNGLWESSDSGASWLMLSPNPCTDVILTRDPAQPTVSRLVAGFVGLGVEESQNTGAGWGTFSPVAVPGAPNGSSRVVFGVCRTQPHIVYAAFSPPGSGSIAHVARSDDFGETWNARVAPTDADGDVWASEYNMAIQPHPTDPDTVLLGVVNVFKSTDGGGTWDSVSYDVHNNTRVHSDCHVIVFHPTDVNKVFVGCDGGFFCSPDVGVSWEARNQDLSTIQHYDLSQHPRYEAIMIAGSQDNGGFHYSGAPIWRRHWARTGVTRQSMGGDTVIAQIDPHDPYVHYYAEAIGATLRRSENAGRQFTILGPKFPGTEWWIPFYPDPRVAGAVFTGGDHLMRSADRGDNWDEVTTELASPLRAVAFHPSDPLVVYLGTVGGQVYRVKGPSAGAWDPASAVLQDVTFTGLPAGVGISSLAIDPAGNVWATVSSLGHAEGFGEFSNDHVFRLGADTNVWEVKSDGLAQANPINAIVIDPQDPTKVYCGGDRGVFSWNASLQRWFPMDEGFPNAPVIKLLIHEPSRKIRAATYGRGVWERSLDGKLCSDHFLYFRDNVVDSGNPPTLDGAPHPYVQGESCWHWQSEDIIVDSTDQTSGLVTSPLELYDNVEHDGARRGANRVYVTVHNKGPFAVTNVEIRAFFTDASAGLPGFPPGLLTDPFSWSPGPSSSLVWRPVGPAFSIPRIEPGTTRLASWELVIPPDASSHSCLLAFATSAEDPFHHAGITNPDHLVVHNRKVTLKNLDLGPIPDPGFDEISEAPRGTTRPREFCLNCIDQRESFCAPMIVPGPLPRDAVAVIALPKGAREQWDLREPKTSRNTERVRELFAGFKRHPREFRDYDFKNLWVADVKQGGKLSLGSGQFVGGKPLCMLIWIHSRRWDPTELYSLHLVQMHGKATAGGFTMNLAKRNPAKRP